MSFITTEKGQTIVLLSETPTNWLDIVRKFTTLKIPIRFFLGVACSVK